MVVRVYVGPRPLLVVGTVKVDHRSTGLIFKVHEHHFPVGS
jgi:hypothetical protein